MKIAIGAIFRDEYEYIIEWLAWHQIAGFDTFYIADNASSDGSTALLEALSDLGFISLIYQPVIEKRVQILAYNRVIEMAMGRVESILFIDADEFLTHESMKDGAEFEHLKHVLTQPKVGMVGINWRVFGSSGHLKYIQEPVVERFTDCCSDKGKMNNGHLKSVTKIAYITSIDCHLSTVLAPWLRVDVNGKELTEFIVPAGVTKHVVSSPLRVNHYVIKSKQEFIEKKRKRGDAIHGTDYDRGMAYFHAREFKDEKFCFPSLKIQQLKNKMLDISFKIKQLTCFNRQLKGVIDVINERVIVGWLLDEKGNSQGLSINIFVNGLLQGTVSCGFFREGLKNTGQSKDGLNGFRYTYPRPLSTKDVVEVKVHANKFKFPKNSSFEFLG